MARGVAISEDLLDIFKWLGFVVIFGFLVWVQKKLFFDKRK
jgi:hypothetical protein